MAGLGGCQGQPDGVEVTQLAHQNHVWVFAQGCAQARGETGGVPSDFSLVHVATSRGVDEFDRVFQSQDVPVSRVVEVLHQSGQGGAFAAAGGARDEDQAAVGVQPRQHCRRHAQCGERRHRVWQQSHHQRGAECVFKGVDSVSAVGRPVQGEIQIGRTRAQASRLQGFVTQGLGLLGTQHVRAQLADVAVDANPWGLTRGQVQVAGLRGACQAEPVRQGRGMQEV